MPQVADLVGRALSYMAKCFVINACGTIDEEMRAVLPATDEDRAFLADPAHVGGSSIISANSRVLAGPMGPEEGILYAEIELEVAVRFELTHDFAGHYNRPDVFQLVLNTDAPQLLRRTMKSGKHRSTKRLCMNFPSREPRGKHPWPRRNTPVMGPRQWRRQGWVWPGSPGIGGPECGWASA